MTLREEVVTKIAAGEHPVPPYPHPHDAAFKITLDSVVASWERGSFQRFEDALAHAVVLGWYEGHLFAVDGPFNPASLARGGPQ